ncbi:MAG: hypothetical protein AAGD35_13610 [Actinomycetota bacterium]
MHAFRIPISLSAVYVVLAGIALFLALFVFTSHPSGLDCSDAYWDANPATEEERDAIYRDLGDSFRVWIVATAAIGIVPLAMALAWPGGKVIERVVAAVPVLGVWGLCAFLYSISLWLYACP